MRLHHLLAVMIVAGTVFCIGLAATKRPADPPKALLEPEANRARANAKNPAYGKVQWEISIFRPDGTKFDRVSAISYLPIEMPELRHFGGDDYLTYQEDGIRQRSRMVFIGGVPQGWVVKIAKVSSS